MNDPSCVMLSNLLGGDVMGYISHQNVLSSWILGLLSYQAKWGEMLSMALCIIDIWTSVDVSAERNHFFSFWLLSRRADINILWMLLLRISLFPFILDASPPVFPWIFDLTAKIGQGIFSKDLMNRECNCSVPSKFNRKCVYKGKCRSKCIIY